MSNETTNTVALEVKKNEAGETYYEVSQGVRIVEVQITNTKSDFSGVTYHRPEFETTGAAIEKYGEEAVLDMINSKLALLAYQRTINKIKGQFGDNDAANAAILANIKATSPVVFSVQDAAELKPGERASSPAGLLRQIAKLQKESLELNSQGKPNEAIAKLQQMSQIMERFQAALASQAASLEAAASVEV